MDKVQIESMYSQYIKAGRILFSTVYDYCKGDMSSELKNALRTMDLSLTNAERSDIFFSCSNQSALALEDEDETDEP